MADIWPVFEGREPTRGEPWATLRLEEAVDLMRLSPDDRIPGDRLSAPDRAPRFGRQDQDLRWLGYRHVIVEIRAEESRQEWQPGFYRSPLAPREALNNLLRHAISRDLGDVNVLRVEASGSVDTEGERTLRLMVVLSPDAVRRIAPDASIAAFGNLLQRLDDIGIKGTPTIQYVTEAELAEGDA